MMHDVRTTLTIDDDVLAAVKGLAEHQAKPIGEVMSALARQALQPAPHAFPTRNGVPQFRRSSGGTPITPELVKELDEDFPQ